MNATEALTCPVCGQQRASMKARASHERRAHPEWKASPDLQRARTNFKNRRWKAAQGPAYRWIDAANQTAASYGLPPLSIRTPLPEGPCTYCGGEATGWDHIIPFARGGAHVVENLTPACWPCNQRKNQYDADVFAMPIRVTLLCGWCWTPVERRATDVRHVRWVACSLVCQGNLTRNPLPFGRPWRPGTHARAIA